MKTLVKYLLSVLFLILVMENVEAKPFSNPIDNSIKKASISKSAFISVSFKDLKTGKIVYDYNSKAPMSPASVQKLVTILPTLNVLGENYEYKTSLYKNKNNYLYLKLGADPYLTSSDLKNMVKTAMSKKIYTTSQFYIDDSIMDSNEWGEGWQWDNDLNSLMPRFGAYNLDKNLITINITPTTKGAPPEIETEVFYPTAFMNSAVTGNSNSIQISRRNYISPDVITVEGTVASDYSAQIPVNYPRRYFILRLEEIFRRQKFAYYGDFNRLKLPSGVYLIAETKHPFSKSLDDILKNSNNMMAETTFKLAGGKWAKEAGSMGAAIDMFNDYYKRKGIETDNQKIVDGSGVSKNNLLTADFISEVLLKESKDNTFATFKTHMASPGEGTLRDRMLYLQNNLKAKTGTLTNVSTIAGYLTSKSGKNYAFCIMINDPKSKNADKKSFEEYVIREAYSSL